MQYSLYGLSRSKVGSNTIQYCTLAICIRIYENQVIELASIRNRFKIVFLTRHNLPSPLLAGARASDGGLLRAGLRQQGRQDHTAGKITLFSWIKPKKTLRMLSVLRRSSQSSTNVSELRIDFILKLLPHTVPKMIWIFALKPSMLWLEQTLVYIWLLMLGYIYSINKQKSDVIRSIHSSRDKIGTVYAKTRNIRNYCSESRSSKKWKCRFYFSFQACEFWTVCNVGL